VRFVDPNPHISEAYMNEAKQSLSRADKNLHDNDVLWATVVLYYAEYYALYSFLQRIGVKCENHACSIMAVEYLLSKNLVINEHRKKRIDAQYYIRVEKRSEVQNMLMLAKVFQAQIDNLNSELDEEDIQAYRNKLKAAN